MPAAFPRDNILSDEWVIAAGGALTATATAWLFCHWLQSNPRSWGGLVLMSSGYVACAALAGGVGAWFLISLGESKNRLELGPIVAGGAVGWVWTPAIILLLWQGSIWALMVAAVAAVSMAACVQNAVPIASSTVLHDPTRDRSWYPRITSICLHGAMLAIVVRSFVTATILLAICGFVLTWHLMGTGGHSKSNKGPVYAFLRLTWVMALAIVITSIALLPRILSRSASEISRLLGLRQNPRERSTAKKQSQNPPNGPSYQSIILWTVHKEKKIVVPLTAPVTLLPIGKNSAPMIIPFDGSYWYFKAPDKSPAREPHLAYGSPLSVDIHSADLRGLIMEAHQDIGNSIDLACCRGIQVDVKNANVLPGTIFLALILKDSSSPGKPSEYLGLQAVPSSELARSSGKFSITDDVLQFTIPVHPRIRKFDEITVAIFPPPAWATEGSKIAIRQFVLRPR